MPNEALKIFGPLSILIMVISSVLLLRFWPQGRKKGISGHGGSHVRAYWLFGASMTVSGVLFYVFARWWLAPTLQLVNLFNILLFAGVVLQLVSAWIPERSDDKALSRWHNRAAFSMAFVMMLLVGCIVFAGAAPAMVHWLAAGACAYMLLSWYLFLFVKQTHRNFLVYQLLYITAFYAVILAASYVR